MAAELEVRLDPLDQRRQPQPLEPLDLRQGELVVGEVGQRRATPEGEGRCESGCGVRGVPGSQRLASLGDSIVEAIEIELARLDPQLVPMPARDQHTLAQEAPQLRDVVLEDLRRARQAPRLAPELVEAPACSVETASLAWRSSSARSARCLPLPRTTSSPSLATANDPQDAVLHMDTERDGITVDRDAIPGDERAVSDPRPLSPRVAGDRPTNRKEAQRCVCTD